MSGLDCTPQRPCYDIENCRCVNLGPVCGDFVGYFIFDPCDQCGWDLEDHEDGP